MPDEQQFRPEDTPSALADRIESEKALADMDAALITPLFFIAAIVSLVTFVMVILTGAPT